MALTSAHQRSAALTDRLRSARERLSGALHVMDYGLALCCQVEIDDLQGEISALEQRYNHVSLVKRNERFAARDYAMSAENRS